jgi:hypothetical protein
MLARDQSCDLSGLGSSRKAVTHLENRDFGNFCPSISNASSGQPWSPPRPLRLRCPRKSGMR